MVPRSSFWHENREIDLQSVTLKHCCFHMPVLRQVSSWPQQQQQQQHHFSVSEQCYSGICLLRLPPGDDKSSRLHWATVAPAMSLTSGTVLRCPGNSHWRWELHLLLQWTFTACTKVHRGLHIFERPFLMKLLQPTCLCAGSIFLYITWWENIVISLKIYPSWASTVPIDFFSFFLTQVITQSLVWGAHACPGQNHMLAA